MVLLSDSTFGEFVFEKDRARLEARCGRRLIIFFERRIRIIRNLSDPRLPAKFSNTLTKTLNVSIWGFPKGKI
jgi:hypothetical protein